MNPSKRTILVTGGAGFIGSEFVRQGVQRGYKIIVVDKLTYAGDLARLKESAGEITFYKTDISHLRNLTGVFKKERPDVIAHFAAETHVDRSLQNALPFIQTNIIGTQNLLELARDFQIRKFLHISTDEVYGDSAKGRFKEDAPLKPNNPYSASKASAELLVRSAVRTYHLPAIIIRPSNNYGPWQYPEKFIPVIIVQALKGRRVPVYGEGRQIREWLHVCDCVRAVDLILRKGAIGETYNIGSGFEKENLTTAQTILHLLGKSKDLIQFVQDRPGHDFRYSIDYAKLKKLGWKPKIPFPAGIRQTIHWYKENFRWVEGKALSRIYST